MVSGFKSECSFSSWYPAFEKNSLKATILQIPDDVLRYLEHDDFVLPVEAARSLPENAQWSDGTPVTGEEEEVFVIRLVRDIWR